MLLLTSGAEFRLLANGVGQGRVLRAGANKVRSVASAAQSKSFEFMVLAGLTRRGKNVFW
jgi:hypothetical protein